MSFWIEVRCTKMLYGCYSAVGHDTPMQLTADNTLASITLTILRLSKKAKEGGWVEIDKDWVCPVCKAK